MQYQSETFKLRKVSHLLNFSNQILFHELLSLLQFYNYIRHLKMIIENVTKIFQMISFPNNCIKTPNCITLNNILFNEILLNNISLNDML